jgi:hypothetical protein
MSLIQSLTDFSIPASTWRQTNGYLATTPSSQSAAFKNIGNITVYGKDLNVRPVISNGIQGNAFNQYSNDNSLQKLRFNPYLNKKPFQFNASNIFLANGQDVNPLAGTTEPIQKRFIYNEQQRLIFDSSNETLATNNNDYNPLSSDPISSQYSKIIQDRVGGKSFNNKESNKVNNNNNNNNKNNINKSNSNSYFNNGNGTFTRGGIPSYTKDLKIPGGATESNLESNIKNIVTGIVNGTKENTDQIFKEIKDSNDMMAMKILEITGRMKDFFDKIEGKRGGDDDEEYGDAEGSSTSHTSRTSNRSKKRINEDEHNRLVREQEEDFYRRYPEDPRETIEKEERIRQSEALGREFNLKYSKSRTKTPEDLQKEEDERRRIAEFYAQNPQDAQYDAYIRKQRGIESDISNLKPSPEFGALKGIIEDVLDDVSDISDEDDKNDDHSYSQGNQSSTTKSIKQELFDLEQTAKSVSTQDYDIIKETNKSVNTTISLLKNISESNIQKESNDPLTSYIDKTPQNKDPIQSPPNAPNKNTYERTNEYLFSLLIRTSALELLVKAKKIYEKYPTAEGKDINFALSKEIQNSANSVRNGYYRDLQALLLSRKTPNQQRSVIQNFFTFGGDGEDGKAFGYLPFNNNFDGFLSSYLDLIKNSRKLSDDEKIKLESLINNVLFGKIDDKNTTLGSLMSLKNQNIDQDDFEVLQQSLDEKLVKSGIDLLKGMIPIPENNGPKRKSVSISEQDEAFGTASTTKRQVVDSLFKQEYTVNPSLGTSVQEQEGFITPTYTKIPPDPRSLQNTNRDVSSQFNKLQQSRIDVTPSGNVIGESKHDFLDISDEFESSVVNDEPLYETSRFPKEIMDVPGRELDDLQTIKKILPNTIFKYDKDSIDYRQTGSDENTLNILNKQQFNKLYKRINGYYTNRDYSDRNEKRLRERAKLFEDNIKNFFGGTLEIGRGDLHQLALLIKLKLNERTMVHNTEKSYFLNNNKEIIESKII